MYHIKKAKHFAKSKRISVTFLYTKIRTLYIPQFFMKILKFAFIYKKHDTLHYVKFLYTKIQTLRKKQDKLPYVLYTKIWTLCVTRFFIEFFKLEEGGGVIRKKQCTLRYILYAKKCTLR